MLDAKNIQLPKNGAVKDVLADKKAAVLFAAKAEPSNLFKALSMQFGKRLAFVLSTDKEAAAAFGVKTFPTLVVTDNGVKAEVFSGKPTIEEMTVFLDKFAAPKPEAKKSQQEEKQTPPPAPKVEYDKVVEEIKTEEEWLKKCDIKAGFCGVAMLDPEEEGGEERHKKVCCLLFVERRIFCVLMLYVAVSGYAGRGGSEAVQEHARDVGQCATACCFLREVQSRRRISGIRSVSSKTEAHGSLSGFF
jgi:hypothetical protein